MIRKSQIASVLSVVALIASALLVACGATAAPTAMPTAPASAATTAPPTVVPTTAVQPTIPAPTATAVPKATAVGGSLTIVMPTDIDTLDAAVTNSGYTTMVTALIGGGPLIVDPTGRIVGYHMESWKVSDDGLTVDFTLKKGIKFHDGTPLTAQDYAYTWQRIKDPATRAGAGANAMGMISSIEAVDDYTLRLKLSAPFFPLLYSIAASRGYLIPLSKSWVEKVGDQIGRRAMSAGPFKFKEWRTGDRVILERNPDFNWGPSFLNNGGPSYYDTIQVRFIAEYETIVAGLESGEIDSAAFQPKDLQRIKAVSKLQVMEQLGVGLFPYLTLNVSKPPFDDLRVRKAFNLAVDRDALIKVALQGQGVPQYGPISPATIGYWSGVEKIGYHFDLTQAKDLMKQAGYTPGPDGMLQKDGKPLKVTLITPTDPNWYSPVEALQQQYKALGVDVKIEVLDKAVLVQNITTKSEYDLSTMGWVTAEADGLYTLWYSKGFNCGKVADPELDKLLEASRITVDPTKRQEVVNQAQRRIVEQAYCVPLYARKAFAAVSTRVKGIIGDPTNTIYQIYFESGWIQEK